MKLLTNLINLLVAVLALIDSLARLGWLRAIWSAAASSAATRHGSFARVRAAIGSGRTMLQSHSDINMLSTLNKEVSSE